MKSQGRRLESVEEEKEAEKGKKTGLIIKIKIGRFQSGFKVTIEGEIDTEGT